MADSTTRWAEALREISGRLGELPGEQGFPAYLSSRLAEFYERAAHVETLQGEDGSVTIRLIDAGGDLVQTGDPVRNAEDPKLMEVAVDQMLDEGAYTVAWRGIGDDGHVVRNDFGFRVTAGN